MMERGVFSTGQYVTPKIASSCRAASSHPVKLPEGCAAGFDSLTSRSLSLWASLLSRFPSRSLLGSARRDDCLLRKLAACQIDLMPPPATRVLMLGHGAHAFTAA